MRVRGPEERSAARPLSVPAGQGRVRQAAPLEMGPPSHQVLLLRTQLMEALAKYSQLFGDLSGELLRINTELEKAENRMHALERLLPERFGVTADDLLRQAEGGS